MSNSITDIEGIGDKYADNLRGHDIQTCDDLLDRCADKKGRKTLADASGISEKLLLRWVNHADLMRIKGIGGEYAELLEAAGVDTVKELRHRKPENLAAKMAEVNESKALTRRVPSAAVVTGWVDSAKDMDPRVSH